MMNKIIYVVCKYKIIYIVYKYNMNNSYNKKQCILFDFDCTLTSKHFFYYINNDEIFHKIHYDTYDVDKETQKLIKLYTYKKFEEVFDYNHNKKNQIEILNFKNDEMKNYFIDLIFGGKDRFNKLNNFLKEIKLISDLYILTSGFIPQVNKILELLDMKIYFKKVYGKNFNEINSKPKYAIIERIFWNYYKKIIFIDDESKNIKTLYFKKNEEYFNKNDNRIIYDNMSKILVLVENNLLKFVFINTLEENTGNGIDEYEFNLTKEFLKQKNINDANDLDKIINYGDNNS